STRNCFPPVRMIAYIPTLFRKCEVRKRCKRIISRADGGLSTGPAARSAPSRRDGAGRSPQRVLLGDVLPPRAGEEPEGVLLHEGVVAEVEMQAALLLEAAQEAGL